MTIDMPYFMENDEWYFFDENEFMYKLTEHAPPKAVAAYKEFYDELAGRLKYDTNQN